MRLVPLNVDMNEADYDFLDGLIQENYYKFEALSECEKQKIRDRYTDCAKYDGDNVEDYSDEYIIQMLSEDGLTIVR